MNVFYKKYETQEDGRNYLVLRSKPIFFIVFILLIASMVILGLIADAKRGSWVTATFTIAGLALFLLIIQVIESRAFLFRWYSNFWSKKEVRIIRKGGTTINFSSPMELWIEK